MDLYHQISGHKPRKTSCNPKSIGTKTIDNSNQNVRRYKMRIQIFNSGTSKRSFKPMAKRTLVLLSVLFCMANCATMERSAQSIGEGLIHVNNVHQQNIQQNQRMIEWQNANRPDNRLPMRPIQVQQYDINTPPVYTNNPSQQFLNQGMNARPGGY